MTEAIHVVCFDVPYPADYGGVIDVYYRIKAFHELGIKVKLHCFEYGRGRPKELEEIVEEVHYYPRFFNLINHLSFLPFIVKSRLNRSLLDNLLKDEHPIWFEGIHCCGYLGTEELKSRNKIIRLHNDEADYYAALVKSEKDVIKQLYNRVEAFKLRLFEKRLKHADLLFTISHGDQNNFEKKFDSTHYLPAFVEEGQNEINTVFEDYFLYHGNLQVSENQESAIFMTDIFKSLPYRLIVAGKNPSNYLKTIINGIDNIELVENPDKVRMDTLIAKARLNCLPTFQSTGVKLKLINALRIGGEVLANTQMMQGTGLEKFCLHANEKGEWIKKIEWASQTEADIDQLIERKRELGILYNNKNNAKQMLELLAEVQ